MWVSGLRRPESVHVWWEHVQIISPFRKFFVFEILAEWVDWVCLLFYPRFSFWSTRSRHSVKHRNRGLVRTTVVERALFLLHSFTEELLRKLHFCVFHMASVVFFANQVRLLCWILFIWRLSMKILRYIPSYAFSWTNLGHPLTPRLHCTPSINFRAMLWYRKGRR